MTAARGDQPLLRIRGLHVAGLSEDEQWRDIVSGIDLDLRRGEVLGLIGESGAGKSTLGLAVMGYARDGCRITGGEVVFDGQDLLKLSERRRRRIRGARIAYVAQSAAAAFNPAHRLIEQYVEGPVQHGRAGRARAIADAIGLYRRMHLPQPETIGRRYPHQVSGGQLQRAMTAMAMACGPELIVFDEPTTALDVTTQIEVLASIKETVRQSGTAAIYITHDLAVVAQMADRIMVLRHGKLVEEGETEAIMERPRQPYTRSLWAVRSLSKEEQPPPVDGVPLLSVQAVTAAYRSGEPVLQDVSFAVHRGRTVAVVGESGSGKSTAARVITGLLPPRDGRIVFDGRALPDSLDRRGRDDRRRLQMIYQSAETALNPRQTVGDIIGRPASFYFGRDREAVRRRVAEILEMIELPASYAGRYPGELSGGQRQRIGIARALAAEPDLIICDEVTSALDQLVAEGILKLLLGLQRDLGLSYLFITHDLATVKAIADEVVVMHRGRVVEKGLRSAVLTPPHDPYTALLLASVPQMDPHWLDRLLAARASAGASL